jgi:exopolyphosphatase/guanosine-5'-triphosphate,3'-diphosphate pyrophosphatase
MATTNPRAHYFASIDIGTNSFHLLMVRADESGVTLLQRRGEKVQLGAKMNTAGLTAAAIERGLQCLRAFKQDIDRAGSSVRVAAVATQALREAANRALFIEPAEAILQTKVEVISGEREAELIYRGVAQSLAEPQRPHLVIDIGGGSVELIVGRDKQPRQIHSLVIGCLSFLRYFPGGEINRDHIDAAYQAALAALQEVAPSLAGQWQYCVGASGVLLAIEQVLIAHGLVDRGISRQGLQQLLEPLLAFEHIEAVGFDGLNESRRHVFASGLVLCLALFDGLGIEQMTLSPGALREGLMYQLLAESGVSDSAGL